MPFEGLLALQGAVIGMLLVYASLVLFPLLYILVRWRARGEGEPGLGLRAGVLYFRNVGLLLALSGITLALYASVSERDMEEEMRTALGLILGAGVFSVVHMGFAAALGRPQGAGDDPAARIFGGFNLLIAGVLVLVGLITLALAITMRGDNEEAAKLGGCIVGVWAIAYLAQASLLVRQRAP